MVYSFTKRTGGVSHGAFASLNLGLHVGDNPEDVMSNREIAGKPFGRVQFMDQVHGSRVAIIEEVSDEAPTADALITGIPGIALAVMVADCIPLLLQSEEAVAAVHVGRKGLINDVTRKTLATMREMGASEIRAIMGPSICGNCYEVSEEIYREVVELHPLAASQVSPFEFALDLPAALLEVLRGEGVDCEVVGECTVESDELFSYRRDCKTGRQAGIIAL